ncbi:glycosyltransferase family 4 protein [Photobacterium sp. TLY01]|uniref:glycosyltransferase family 4 protein n=1 Tax=Photobacterium sp. TLY01 TaxID=2907534 RepID=UPI001F2B0595|nr:glycosyltransferase family 4 protein [Photobacterium sp. TLY01]UIP30116.1 glycosyltransferase family 4 protein [Photobacterium sp. TLY01]
MKILYHHRVASKDGQYVHIEAIIGALREQGHEVVVVAPAVSDQAAFGADGGWVSKVRRMLPRFLSEILEFGYSAYDFGKLCITLYREKPDAIYERYNLFLPSGILAKQLFNVPLILEINAPLFDERNAYGGLSLTWLARWSELFTWRNADHTLPVSHVLASYVRGAGVPEPAIRVIPNGIDSRLFHPAVSKEKKPEFADSLVVGFVGFCREWHQLDHVLSLIVDFNRQRNPDDPEVKLLIVGDGPVLDDLKKQARALKAEHQIHITGLIDREHIPEWLSQIDIALQPAVTPWCSPLKLIEYLACGKAIVAPDSKNIQELLRDGENALLFQADHLPDMLEQIKRLLSDEALRQQLSDNAAASIARQQLTWSDNARKIVSIFESLISKS